MKLYTALKEILSHYPWTNDAYFKKAKEVLDHHCPECGKEMSEAFGSHKLFCQMCHPEEYIKNKTKITP